MANIGLLSGLAAGFGSLAKSYSDKEAEDRQDERLAKKMQLARDLQLEVLKAKQEFAKSNPVYKNFIKTDSGDIVGMSAEGQASVVHPASEADAAAIAAKTGSLDAYRKAQTALLTSMAGPKAEALDADIELKKARTKALSTPKPKGNPISAADFEKQKKTVVDSLAAQAGLGDIKSYILPPEDIEKANAVINDPNANPALKARATADLQGHAKAQEIYKQAENQLIQSGYKPGAYRQAGLLAPADDGDGGDTEAPEENAFMDMIPDSNNPAG